MLKLKNIVLTSPVTEDEYKYYYHFRWQQLRQPLDLPLGSEQDKYESVSFHCMARIANNEIVGVGRISPESNRHIPQNQMRIRFMAVIDHYRSLGIGSRILQNLLSHADANNISRCWLNARSDAVTFYEKNGFEVVKSIETDLTIPHFEMEIYLKP